MKVLLFGSNGMLGRYVKYVLEQSFQVIPFTREDFDIEKNTWDYLELLLAYHLSPQDIIINCAGLIPQRIPETELASYIKVNSLFPHQLQNIATKHHATLIHISTDAVFAGNAPPYTEHSPHTATDLYGISKSQGEPPGACIIRTSIVGEDPVHKTSFLEWVRQHTHTSLPGYTNHLWNGVTCLQLANIIHFMIATKTFWKGPRHIFSPSLMTKYFLCHLISDLYNLNNTILPTEAPIVKNMELQSIYPPICHIDPLPLQIKKQKDFSLMTPS
jgi:dTDP-4-dehydrorhamnose reductase